MAESLLAVTIKEIDCPVCNTKKGDSCFNSGEAHSERLVLCLDKYGCDRFQLKITDFISDVTDVMKRQRSR